MMRLICVPKNRLKKGLLINMVENTYEITQRVRFIFSLTYYIYGIWTPLMKLETTICMIFNTSLDKTYFELIQQPKTFVELHHELQQGGLWCYT